MSRNGQLQDSGHVLPEDKVRSIREYFIGILSGINRLKSKSDERRTTNTPAECMPYCIRKLRGCTQQMPSLNTACLHYSHPPTTLQSASMLWETLHNTWPHGCSPLHEVSASTETRKIMRELGSPAGRQRQTRGMLPFLHCYRACIAIVSRLAHLRLCYRASHHCSYRSIRHAPRGRCMESIGTAMAD